MYSTLLILIFTVIACHAQKARYDGYKVFRLVPKNEEQVKVLKKLEDYDAFDVWHAASEVGRAVDVMVPPYMKYDFKSILWHTDMEPEVFVDDVQNLIENDKADLTDGNFGWRVYHSLDEIYDWLHSLEDRYPKTVRVVRGGKSYEGRDILGVHVSFKPQNHNRSIFIEGGIHAREWISPATVTYMLNEILSSTNPSVRKVAERYDWYVFPNFNPDGYHYSFTKARMWRHNRAPHGRCYGADLNRNFGFKWMQGGASKMPCAPNYAGPEPFSEVETRTISKYLSSISRKLIGYFSFHSYRQVIAVPYGHTREHLDNYDQLYSIGRKGALSLSRRYGTNYKVGNIVEVIYIATGGSVDWVKGVLGVPITYVYELRDTGKYGFLLPAKQIIPTGQETLDSMLTILNEFDKDGI